MSELFFDVFEQPISTATIVSLAQSCAEQLAEVPHDDETGLSIAGKRHWVHVSATPSLTHYEAHAKCGKQALDAIGIPPSFRGVSVMMAGAPTGPMPASMPPAMSIWCGT